jgi:hypothetical protein
MFDIWIRIRIRIGIKSDGDPQHWYDQMPEGYLEGVSAEAQDVIRTEFFPSRIQIFSIPDPGSASKSLTILTQIPDPNADFLPIPDPDLATVSTTLL